MRQMMRNEKNQEQLPVYVRVGSALLEDMALRKYRVGEKFYSQNSVVEKFNVSLLTARRALGLLEDEGYIRREKGKGAFISALPNEPSRLRVIEDCAIGLLICDPPHSEDNVAFQKWLMGIEQEASREGYLLQIGRQGSKNIPRMIENNHVEGVIVIGNLREEIVGELKELPAVVVGEIGTYDFHHIANNAEMAGYQVGKYLLGLGHKKIGIISGNSLITEANDMFYNCIKRIDALAMKGIEKAFAESGMNAEENRRFFRVDGGKTEYLLTKELLAEDDTVTAILVMNWLGVLNSLRAINELGMKVPQDISIIGYGDNAVAMHTTPSLTSVKLFNEEIGAEAVKLLTMLIKDPVTVPRRVLWRTELIVRESCADLRVR